VTDPHYHWVDEVPPTPTTADGRTAQERRDAMRANPGHWLIWGIMRGSPTYGTVLRSEGYETAIRTTEDGRRALYVRWPVAPTVGETTIISTAMIQRIVESLLAADRVDVPALATELCAAAGLRPPYKDRAGRWCVRWVGHDLPTTKRSK
jgi:hypothetical protein